MTTLNDGVHLGLLTVILREMCRYRLLSHSDAQSPPSLIIGDVHIESNAAENWLSVSHVM